MKYNKVFLVGNLARDPELRYTPAGVAVARFAIAVNRSKKSGESQADFISVVAWRRLAEICGEYLKKGRPIAVTGQLEVRSFIGKDGQQRTFSEVVLDDMQMLGKKPDETSQSSASAGKEDQTGAEEAPF
ncbi:hypothetical protein A3J90_05600 [candidate division WOR-1 bacterium RIFOXYC2_FULL_37_10]|uniref:Single-stranded DNA-binding protein n=1 Tax=candidate division WOR-1 bacterium RIFOXYB2_FULL_37_13 TaxID=1802579 RepID=A0A1F4SDU9_UNCSA|nr:MAG: hypothetical protein A2246_05410 [candidate division WOR-1 bacterium RIFOXYA2_FULL_37_7]OGC18580.1 MAG: hypothetical protein A2310_02090 [candidate division WOR-1 bacterium RIFOXYB2_FULL_37_13]OGC37113.1 MAG: hypothetical protein A3J90_05600 [candidate division WOR-1 bacterium RIFOXYC2_FULL_37_10]